MNISGELTEFIMDQLSPLGRFVPRKMFGCLAIFHDGLMVLLINNQGEIFVKTDDRNRSLFDQAGCPPFTYTRRGEDGKLKTICLSFSQLPDDAMEEQETFVRWVASGIEAARRTALPKGKSTHAPTP
ncbi:TfoX/Sxy family protein [Pectobacterium sp. PL64]|uniref:TfoX/Sxy family protein n=1 Tax=Pectobacterium sp. PL64 TaxID=2738983 RepID=UPI001F0CA429|nr:TfoX/Sxy family protein [Pectobacterium sp. PL64]UMO87495.1 TfoX/Sxy family protein [Pectobacterium sp. PL64]